MLGIFQTDATPTDYKVVKVVYGNLLDNNRNQSDPRTSIPQQ